MRTLLVVLLTGLVGTCLGGCGDTIAPTTAVSRSTSTNASKAVSSKPTDTAPAPVETKVDGDKDNDLGAADDDSNNDSVLDYGHAAAPAEAHAIKALVERYYAAALAENGAKACSILYSTLAESVPEDYGQSPPGPAYMRGTTCPTVMTLFFKHVHPQVALEYPKLKVVRVRLVERHGLVVLRFGRLPEREIPVDREGHTWRISALLDTPLP